MVRYGKLASYPQRVDWPAGTANGSRNQRKQNKEVYVMRTLTRKLLSLLLAFTMVCAMVPAAMAADEGGTEGSINWNDPTCVGGDSHNPVKGATDPATCTETGTQHYTCSNPGCTATGTAVISALGHDFDSSNGSPMEQSTGILANTAAAQHEIVKHHTRLEAIRHIPGRKQATLIRAKNVRKQRPSLIPGPT